MEREKYFTIIIIVVVVVFVLASAVVVVVVVVVTSASSIRYPRAFHSKLKCHLFKHSYPDPSDHSPSPPVCYN